MALEPVDGFGVEVVRGLVEQQQVGLLEEQLAQGDAAPLAAGQDVDGRVGGRALKGVHRLLELGVHVPGVAVVEGLLQLAQLGEQGVVVGVGIGQRGADLVVAVEHALDVGDGLLDVLEDGPALGERGLLLEQTHRGALGQEGLAVVDGLEAGHHLEEGRLAGAVGAHDADLRIREEGQRDVVEDELLADGLAHVVHLVDEFSHEGVVFLRVCVVTARRGPARSTACCPANRAWHRPPCRAAGRPPAPRDGDCRGRGACEGIG